VRLSAAIAVIAAMILTCGKSAAASAWQEKAPSYGFKVAKTVSIRMDDGVRLSGDVYYPTKLSDGTKAAGPFPVLLEQTPYGKDQAARSFERAAAYFVARGYILVVAEQRGFGKSQGQAAWFGDRVGKDGVELVQWAAKIDNADGKVGLMGCSYLGVVQYFTALKLPVNSPMKAMAPFCADSNLYRDAVSAGGIPSQMMAAVRALTAPGIEDEAADDPYTRAIISHGTGRDAYYDQYWKSRDATRFMAKIVALGIPILSETGWYDIYPGGNIDTEIAAQNALSNRPQGQVMTLAPSGRYQAIVGPWPHSAHVNDSLRPILLEWFDHWLKDEPSDIADTRTPLHLYLVGGNRWIDAARYPLTDKALSFHLSPGKLDIAADTHCEERKSCNGTLLFAPDGEGSSGMNFESMPLESPVIIGGPADVSVSLKASRPEVELIATLYDVAPDGKVTVISDGAQLGSLRSLNRAKSWYSRDGILVRPAHDFTRASSSSVPPGKSVRLDIELTPIVMRIAAGHKLRLRLTSQPSPTFHQFWHTVQLPKPLLPTPGQLADLIGGVYTIDYNRSVLNLSVADDADLINSARDWGPKN
jgi:hypothetical protein